MEMSYRVKKIKKRVNFILSYGTKGRGRKL